ncbi:phage terminase small subunit [Streptomonospora wellingtoniae]|uniref:Terminase small subunit n=1 Tax=Streptomonospora wellingtoniae TaxID=3075544 RepID=A0ABU2L0J4_9ACTN|nr:hypothetical protein [Streptomonospora sp. DSM 45055]MDT0305076.1 hypothetical protein [Streptomonospora sp. DSM 45055]
MSGPPPKPAAMRQRRNKTSTARRLSAELPKDFTAPELPDVGEREWLPQTRAWWADVWSSPMAPEFIDGHADIHGLYMLALLVDDFWRTGSRELAAEIRLQRTAFGLTPIDRRRLQWEIERTEEAQDRGNRRRGTPPAGGTDGQEPPEDPRSVLYAV